MKIMKKIAKWLFIALLSVALLAAAADAAWVFLPQVAAQKEIAQLAEVARPVDDLQFPANATVFALGEASHGNAEFQALKLSVFQQLVEKRGVRTFALEMDFGEGLLINRYIHGAEIFASAQEAVQQMSFNIYHTRQMAALVEWMRTYNATAAPNAQLSFFGFDLQNPKSGLRQLLQFCESHALLPNTALAPLRAYVNGSYSLASAEAQGAVQCLEEIVQAIEARQETDLREVQDAPFMLRVIQCAQNLLTCLENGGAENYIYYNNTRDAFMAENVLWLLQHAEEQQEAGIMVAGHNGHIAFTQQFYTPMGSHLQQALGKAYFAIGTDYYRTTCNINAAGASTARSDVQFCSADIFAANARFFDGSYFLNFDEALAQNGEAAQLLQQEIYMGSLGEGYTWAMHLLPMSHRIKAVPAQLYNAMVLYDETTPIVVE